MKETPPTSAAIDTATERIDMDTAELANHMISADQSAESPEDASAAPSALPKADTTTTIASKDPKHPEADENSPADKPPRARRRVNWSSLGTYGVLPGLAVLLALCAGFLKWQDSSARDSALARVESTSVAKNSMTALLSYRPGTVEQQLAAARELITGQFRDAYTSLTRDVVIPGAKQKQISAVATIPAAASVSATENHAVVLIFVNQTIIVGQGAPTATTSSVRVTLDRIGGRWLISQFEPI
jgi:Mce-associated membrane protein